MQTQTHDFVYKAINGKQLIPFSIEAESKDDALEKSPQELHLKGGDYFKFGYLGLSTRARSH